MDPDSGAVPLIAGQGEEMESAWEPDREQQPVSDACTVQQMFEEHPTDVLRFLQSRGVEKLAEFTAEDDEVFRAFGDNQLLTFGSDRRYLDAEGEWRAKLRKHRRRLPPGAKGWSNSVALQAYVVEIRDAAAPLQRGLLHPLVRQWQAKRCSYSVFALPAVQAVVSFKWTHYARRLLLAELALYVVWMAAYYTFTGAMQDEDLSLPLSELVRTQRGAVTVAAEALSLLAMAPFLALDTGALFVYGRGWLKEPSNWLDMATYGLQVAIAVMHLGRMWVASQTLTYLLAVQLILLMMRLQYYTQVFRHTRFSFPHMVRHVLKDIGFVLLFIVLVCVAFGAAFHITFRTDKDSPDEFSTPLRAVLNMFEHIYGDLELKNFIDSHNPIFATGLALIYIIIMGFVLVNMVIGVIINSIDKVMEHENAKQLCNQARIIDELEAILPSWFEAAHPDWHPRYIHVLRIDPSKLDAVERDKLWSKHGDFAPVMGGGGDKDDDEHGASENGREHPRRGGGGGGGEGSGRRELGEVRAQLARQEALLRRLCERLEVDQSRI